ncbi:hypothetical protein ACFLS1_13050, partial [Verrucomicrobiota bacterium]
MSRYVKMCLCFAFLFVSVFVCSQQASAQTYTCTYRTWPGASISGEAIQTGLLPGEYSTPVTVVPDPGYYFSRWNDQTTNATRSDLIVDRDRSFTAYVYDLYPDTVTLTVINGSGSGEHAFSSAVPIEATAVIPGKTFHRWSSSGGTYGGSFSNVYDANTIFTMPEENVVITANYVPTGAAMNILVIGNSTSEDIAAEKGFSPVNIGAELRSILTNDPAVNTQMINVVVDDYYRKEVVLFEHPVYNVWADALRYTLAQYYFWPTERIYRLANLRGEDGTPWDYVVLMDDALMLGQNPGLHAEGVNLIADEVRKGDAEPILLMQWPDSSSSFSSSHFREISHRVGDGAGIRVVPAGYAWDTWGSKDTSANHPTPHGAYLAAASIYSEIYNRSATNSTYSYSNAIADHAWTKVQEERTNTHYTGNFAYVSPICYDTNYSRHLDYANTGTSTESGMHQRLAFCLGNMNITYTIWRDQTDFPPELDVPIDFNYGRAPDWGPEKAYDPDPVNHRLAYGFCYQENYDNEGIVMRYSIDKQYSYDYGQSDGHMIRRILDRNEVPLGARAHPDRLMWCKLYDVDNSYKMSNGHRLYYYAITSSSYMLAALSGRCPMADEPFVVGSGPWNLWVGARIGYETAVRMCSLKGRASG